MYTSSVINLSGGFLVYVLYRRFESIPDMSTLPKDGVPIKRSTRGPITKESRERRALMRNDISTTKSAAVEQALVPPVNSYAQSWRRAKLRPCRKSKKRRGVRRRQHMRETGELSSNLPNHQNLSSTLSPTLSCFLSILKSMPSSWRDKLIGRKTKKRRILRGYEK